MHQHFMKITFFLLAFFSSIVNAGTIEKQNVPDKVFNYIYKKHPEAKVLTVVEKTHFGRSLFEVAYTVKDVDQTGQASEEKYFDLFRSDGHFFVNAISMQKDAFNIINSEIENSLQLQYPKFEILEMKSVENPNGVGEEYELDLLFSGKKWNISVDNQGKISTETLLNANQLSSIK